MDWVKRQVSFAEPALQATFLDYVHEVEHAADRIQRLEKAIDDARAAAPAEIQEVVRALQALRGVGKIGAVTVAADWQCAPPTRDEGSPSSQRDSEKPAVRGAG